MHGDFSRDSFNSKNQLLRVLIQQGRPIVDADWNEQSSILVRYLQSLAADVIGWHGGSEVVKSTSGPFVIQLNGGKVEFMTDRMSHYYVDGMLLDVPSTGPKPVPLKVLNEDTADPIPNNILVYLAVWQHFQPDAIDPKNLDQLYDPALLGISGREHLRFELRAVKAAVTTAEAKLKNRSTFVELTYLIKTPSGPVPQSIGTRIPSPNTKLPSLIAWTNLRSPDDEDCTIEDGSGYTGLENQLYRVEVHNAGIDGKTFWNPDDKASANNAFTLKWSRDNGSIAYSATIGLGTATLNSKWKDKTRAIQKEDVVELVPYDADRGPLVKVIEVGEDNGAVTLRFDPPADMHFGSDETILVRRWDHHDRKDFPLALNGGILVPQEKDASILSDLIDAHQINSGDNASVSIPIEDGVVVRLAIPTDCHLEPGDHWLIPARAATSDIIWRKAQGKKDLIYLPEPARYAERHYAPIALIDVANNVVNDLRRKIVPIAVDL